MMPADLLGGHEAFVRPRRRHADVDQRDIRPVALHLAVQRVGVCGEPGHVHAALPQQGGHAVADDRGIVGDHDPQGAAGERVPPRGHDEMAAAQAAQLDLAQVLEPQLLAGVLVGLGELPDHARDEDLATTRQVGDTRGLDDGPAVEVVLADRRLAGVDAHAHADVRRGFQGQGALDVNRTAQRRAGARERQQMPVAQRLDQRAAMLGDAGRQHRLVLGEALQPAGLSDALEQRGGALDIGEQDGDRPGNDHVHIVTHTATPWRFH
jgi:hypothetical protein